MAEATRKRGLSASRRASVLFVGVLVALTAALPARAQTPPPAPTPPATPAPTVPVGPAPFDMPMDTGPKMMAQAAQAKADLAALQPQLAAATAARDEAQLRWDRLTAALLALDNQRSRVVVQLSAAKARLAAGAARAYKSSGGGRINAALEAMNEAGDLLDFSRDLHLINSYGQHEIDVVDELERDKRAVEREILETSRQRVAVKQDLDAANAQVATFTAQLEDAQRRLTEAEMQMARFHELASTAGSPIMGPNRLTAAELAAFIRNNGYHPNITVTIDELAQYYIEEGERLGIRGDVAFAQSILETGGFNFAGSMVEWTDNNYAGIGACDSCSRGFIFPDARHGVRAQMQLLRVYVDPTVTIDSLPDPLLLPGTLRLGFRGRVQSWWDLTGTWATATDYGIRVYDLYLRIVTEAMTARAAAAAAPVAVPSPSVPAPPAPAP
jgi:hypothetical protein